MQQDENAIFEKLLIRVSAVSEMRKKASREVIKHAPGILVKYGAAIRLLGYDSTEFRLRKKPFAECLSYESEHSIIYSVRVNSDGSITTAELDDMDTTEWKPEPESQKLLPGGARELLGMLHDRLTVITDTAERHATEYMDLLDTLKAS